MLSRQIDLATFDVRQSENRRDERNAKDYRDVTGKKSLPNNLKRYSLKALKKLLADAKAKSDQTHTVSAAGPLLEMTIAQATAHESGVDKISPSTQVIQLYHKLIDKLNYITKEGIQKTIFYLDTTAFNASSLRGAQITLTEYSTAPKNFNIHFSADPKAIALLARHAAELQNALNNGNHRFGINRIDTSLLTEDEKRAVPLVERDPESEDDA